MSAVGGNLENKTIGLQFGVSGTFVDCELVDGKVQLKSTGVDSAGNDIYAQQGTWTSEIIDIGDNFKDYGKLFASEIKQGNSSIKLETRTSDDDTTFDEWQTVSSDGTINSTKRRRIQVRVTFYVGYDDANIYISQGNNAEDAKNVFNNDFIDTSNGITLKHEYEFEMTKDTSWTGEGELHKKLINKNDWQKIDKVNVLPSEKFNKTLILHDGEYKKWNPKDKIEPVEIPIKMTSDTTPAPYVISASSTFNTAGYESYLAFDGDENTRWMTANQRTFTPQWIMIDLGINKVVTRYSLISGVRVQMVKAFSFEGSMDGVSWIELDKQQDVITDTSTEYLFDINNVEAYRYYRLYITSISDTTSTQQKVTINSIKLYEAPSSIVSTGWSAFSSTLPTSEQFLSEGMDSLTPLIDRRVEALEPLPMNKSEILLNNDGKLFAKTIDLNKYTDIRNIKVEVE